MEFPMVSVTSPEKPHRAVGSPSGKYTDPMLNKGYYSFYPTETWTPNVNLYETETAYLVCVDLAGVDKKKIGIEVTDGHLTLRGKRPVPSPVDNPEAQAPIGRLRVHLMEIDHGAFARDVELPQDVIQEGITARYDNGMLWIELPKKN
jgi:HSP20 family protein